MPRRGMSNEPNWARRGVGGHGPPYRMVDQTTGGRRKPLSPRAGGRGCQTNPICGVFGVKTRVVVKTKPIFARAVPARGAATAIGKLALAAATRGPEARDVKQTELGGAGESAGTARPTRARAKRREVLPRAAGSRRCQTKPIQPRYRPAGGPPLGISDCRLWIRGSGGLECRGVECQTNPMWRDGQGHGPPYRMLGETPGGREPGMSNKANFLRFWPENEGREENEANLCGKAAAIEDCGLAIADSRRRVLGMSRRGMSNKANLCRRDGTRFCVNVLIARRQELQSMYRNAWTAFWMVHK